jgi:hypothetical protein
MTTEQEWLGNSPYTHPSMPGTSYRGYLDPPPPPVINLTAEVHSAALEDAEGRALVQAIHNPENPRLMGHNRKHMDESADLIGEST